MSVVEPFDAVIFDLDGTLWDTSAACAVGWNRILSRHAIPFRGITEQDVRSVTGLPHEECIRTVFDGLAEPQVRVLIDETMAEDNQIVAESGGVLYAGVADGLTRLASRYPLYIVSNCQSGYIESFLAWSGFGPLFRDVECWGNTGRAKPENLRRVIERNALRAPIFIGDGEGDREAAHANRIPFLHVAYGFGTCAPSESCYPDFAALERTLLTR